MPAHDAVQQALPIEQDLWGGERKTAKGKPVINVGQTGPLNERPGRCGHCGNCYFTLSIKKGHMFRECLKCEQVIDVMTTEAMREGIPGHKYVKDNPDKSI